jgi:hypothetical protein
VESANNDPTISPPFCGRPARLVKGNHDFGVGCRILAPGAEDRRRFFNWHGRADGLGRGESLLLEHADHFPEVLRQRIARAEDVEFLLDKQTGLVADVVLGVSDVDDAAGKGDLLNGGAEGVRPSDGFDDDIGAVTGGDLLEFGVDVVAA